MKKPTKKKLIVWLNQILIFIGIFILITWWQQKDMLSTGTENLSPSFTLVSMDDQVISFEPATLEKKTLIYFFAPWCSVCHASIDNIEAIKESSGEHVNFYIIALDWKSKQEISDFLSQHHLTIPVLLGSRSTSDAFQIRGFPSYYIIDKNGKIKHKNMGYTTELGMRVRLGLTKD
jgi:thiol-disulfide isomerase/thioredoxin